jgi:pterin-4a-carbinolamine dehydratase
MYLKYTNIKKKWMVGMLLKKYTNIKKKWKIIYFFLFKKFNFKNFLDSQNFINNVGKISEDEGHHPDISFGWGYAEIKITTHAIEGLSENDFILAAKIDQLINV